MIFRKDKQWVQWLVKCKTYGVYASLSSQGPLFFCITTIEYDIMNRWTMGAMVSQVQDGVCVSLSSQGPLFVSPP